jgi:tetraacyldisaccharide 4'-kinase
MVFRLGVALRALRFAVAAPRSVSVPVVSVGNLSVGGTGKTPVSAWLVARLAGLGWKPALVARGYGQDELDLHRRWNPEMGLEADPDRIAAAERAVDAGADVVVLDDGFQHRRLARDVDLVLLAAEQGLPRALLPRGPFRESLGALSRAQAVLVTRKTASRDDAAGLAATVGARFPGLPLARARLVPAGWQTLEGEPASPPEGPVLAVCSIAGPEDFFSMVEEATGMACDRAAFADHHDYSEADLVILEGAAVGRCVVVTEKDAVKLRGRWPSHLSIRVLPLRVEFEAGEDELLDLLRHALDRAPDREASS